MQSVRLATARTADEIEFSRSRAPLGAVEGSSVLQPHVRPYVVPARKNRKAPLLSRVNRALRTVLVGMCGLAILGYGLDVAASNDVGKLQEQARRLSEQNTELSAQLLRVISFQGIQDSALGRFGLRVPEQVMIVKEVQPYPLVRFEAQKHHLPLLAGY
jgi:hypothetical protein